MGAPFPETNADPLPDHPLGRAPEKQEGPVAWQQPECGPERHSMLSMDRRETIDQAVMVPMLQGSESLIDEE